MLFVILNDATQFNRIHICKWRKGGIRTYFTWCKGSTKDGDPTIFRSNTLMYDFNDFRLEENLPFSTIIIFSIWCHILSAIHQRLCVFSLLKMQLFFILHFPKDHLWGIITRNARNIVNSYHVFTHLFTLHTPWYFFDFASIKYLHCVLYVLYKWSIIWFSNFFSLAKRSLMQI